jgi:hypothetical protein
VRTTSRPGGREQAQLQRFEVKYLVTEQTARRMRQFVRCYLKPDGFAADPSDPSYAVHTLYLDSPDLSLYRATCGGEKNRFKLRVRFYGDRPDAPAFFEIKRRRNECISKLRAEVRRDAVSALLGGEYPQLRHLIERDSKQLFALQEFCRVMRHLGATPRSHVAYCREAWMSRENNSLRLTFDRQVQCEPQFDTTLHANVDGAAVVEPFERQVIFELKFTSRMPNWCGELARTFGLVRGGAAKYAEGVALIGERCVSNDRVEAATPRRSGELETRLLSGHSVQPV